MNSLDSLLQVCQLIETPGELLLTAHHARTYTTLIDGQTLGDLGCEPILHMRHFQVFQIFLSLCSQGCKLLKCDASGSA